MKCPNCGSAELVPDTRDVPYTVKGDAKMITQVAGDFCPACGEAVFNAAMSRRLSAEMIVGVNSATLGAPRAT